MDYNFKIEQRDGYIYAESSGHETLENSRAVYESIIKKIIEWNCNKVVYIEGFENQIPISEVCVLMDTIFKEVKTAGLKVRFAFYDRNGDHDAVNLLSESLAGAQGINAKVFQNEEDAIAWIKAC
ncbi:MAG: hypothetical protein LJE74_09060 [Proteobacteria bacterium]|nr:hypothetical protein [Pseudomonadota bacterium]MCG6935156.1 hypothetical protein [Pseudomonadota bacterium]